MKRSQIKMGETIAIMVIFFFLLIFGFSFYASIQQRSYEMQLERNLQLKVLQITQKASYLPELQCSVMNIQSDNCFDLAKANIFFQMTKDNESLLLNYYDVLGNSKLWIQEIYPGTTEVWVFNNSIESSTDTLKSMVPVSLYNGTTNTYSVGVLYIEYSRGEQV